RDLVLISANFGVGETVVQGSVDPDEYRVFKPKLDRVELRPILSKVCGEKDKKLIYSQGGSAATKLVSTPARARAEFVLCDDEILTLARWAVAIEAHYGTPMDMEWAKDGETGELYCVQARPETVHAQHQGSVVISYELLDHPQ